MSRGKGPQIGRASCRERLEFRRVLFRSSVIMLVAALITGFDQQVQESIKQYGADTAFISRFDQGPHGGGRRPKEERERKPITLEDGQAIRELCPAVKDLRSEERRVGKDWSSDVCSSDLASSCWWPRSLPGSISKFRKASSSTAPIQHSSRALTRVRTAAAGDPRRSASASRLPSKTARPSGNYVPR